MKKSLLFLSSLFTMWSFAVVKMASGEVTAITAPAKVTGKAVPSPTAAARKNTPPVNGTFPIAQGSNWKYNDSGNDLGSAWKEVSYDDTAWQSGNGKFGYGDAATTQLSFGPNSQNKYPTYYFRNTFTIEDASAYGNLIFDVLRDDGVVVYVNGIEAFRMNMPSGAVNYNTYASSTVGGSDEGTFFESIQANMLVNGVNVIAVEVHQADASSSDLGFDLSVTPQPAPAGPVGVATYPLAKESDWNFLDNGTSLDGTNWAQAAYDYSSWISGPAPLGYGDPMNTVVSFGPDAGNKYITTYFIRDIQIDPAQLTDMVNFGLRRDDGAVVYINGIEVIRDNMPQGVITSTTTSSTIVDGADENKYFIHQLPKTVFTTGVNRIAVELHNRDGQSSDLGFDLYVKNTVNDPINCDEPHIGCFTSIMPTGQTSKMIIAAEHRFQLLHKEGSNYTVGNGTVPGNHDYTAYIPTAGSSIQGRLSVNHENSPGGVSIVGLHLDPVTSLWATDNSQPVDFYNTDLVTTTRNCSGGNTPWGTVITSEESTNAGDVNGDGYQDVGWQVEIDPVTARVKEYGNGKQEKLWAMGRMNHENIVVTQDGTTAYYGEDGGTHCVYKFVADTPGNLTAGTVYVLKLDAPLANNDPTSPTATWIEVPNETPADCNNMSAIAGALGGTNFNGVEDCEINPISGQIYFASKGKDRVYRFTDNGTTISGFETFVGGMSYDIETAQGPVSEPWGDGNDNLVFDNKGNLWVCQDGGLNYIWVVRPGHTQQNPNVKLFASMPAGSEPTGLTFTPDYKYGFFSVQHPNSNNAPQMDATHSNVVFDKSAVVVFALTENLGLEVPTVDFTANEVMVYAGDAVTFTDLSTDAPSSWSWSFEGGSPAVSAQQSPVVTYNAPGTYTVKLSVTNSVGSSPETAKIQYITVQEPLSVEANTLGNAVSVYPNPTNGKVTIELNSTEAGENTSIAIYDLTGRKVYQNNDVKSNGGVQKTEVDLTQFAGGQMFIVNVKTGDKQGSYKLLKVN